ncbi:MAG: phage holin family protein [Propionibacteriaceae bacterium]|nr:phage holin family protein [Propionibacteriaceae bacterium]
MLIRIIANAAAVFVAALLVPGLYLGPTQGFAGLSQGNEGFAQVLTALAVGAIFGVVNAWVKPLVTLLSLPFVVVSLGLFLLVINTVMFMLTSKISGALGLGFGVDGWGAAFLGAIVVSIVAGIVNSVLGGKK